MKRVLKWLAAGIVVLLIAAAGYAILQARAYAASMAKVYAVPPPAITASADPAVIARGKHVTDAIAGCSTRDCHGGDLAGGAPISFGPLGTVTGPNITAAGHGAAYSDGQMARLIVHGIKRDGRSVTFMPCTDFGWLPDDDVLAVVSYLRTLPPVAKPDGKTEIGLLAKVLDRRGMFPLDIARRINHRHRASAPPPSPTVAYGEYMGRLCFGCHGEHLSGGPMPGAPPSMAVPLNLTPHETGLKDWTYADFDRVLTTGTRKNGKPVNALMPVEALGKMNDVEKRALWAYLQSVPPAPFGGR